MNRRPTCPAILGVLAAVVAVAACTAGPTTTASSSIGISSLQAQANATATPSLTISVVPSPSPTSTLAPTVRSFAPSPSGGLPHGALAPGTYTSTTMAPHVRFTVPAGFLMFHEGSDDVSLTEPDEGPAAEFSVERIAGSVVDRLAATPDLVVVGSGTVAVGGEAGRSVTVKVAPKVAIEVDLWSSADTGQTPSSGVTEYLQRGSEARITELTIDSDTVVVIQAGSSTEFTSILAHQKSLLGSIRFP